MARMDLSGGANSCWIWQNAKGPNGYGQAHRFGKTMHAHRLMFELVNGPIPTGMYVCHRCDQPACCNPSHLFLGTPRQNHEDMRNKGRAQDRRGEKCPTSKLSNNDVFEMRRRMQSGESRRAVADAFGVGISTVSQIALSQTALTSGLPPIARQTIAVGPLTGEVTRLRDAGLSFERIGECLNISGSTANYLFKRRPREDRSGTA